MIITTLDFETAYGKHPGTGENITLSKMTTEEYIRHPQFRAHCLGVKIEDEAAFYVSGESMIHFLKTHPWSKTYAVCHHSQFDGAIFSWRAGVRPAMWGDTLAMFRALYPWESALLANMVRVLGLPEKGTELTRFAGKWNLTSDEMRVLGGYCVNDVEITRMAFDKMKPRFPVSELRLIDLTTRLFTEPVLEVDRGVLLDEFKREKKSKRALIKQCVSDKKILASNDQFAALLLSLGVDPPKKVSPAKIKDGRVDLEIIGLPPRGVLPDFKATPKKQLEVKLGRPIPKEKYAEYKKAIAEKKNVYPWSYAFGKGDEKFKMLLDHEDPKIQALIEARMGVKSTIKETRSKRFYQIGKRGKFPVYHRYYGAKTGRDSGGDKQNTTNLNRVDPRDPTSGALRKSLLAPKGHLIVVRDLGQIEARVLAYWAGQEDLLDLFRAGGDPYNRQASLIFGYEVDRKKEEFWLEGMAGKASVLGNGYQMGWGKFQEGLRIGFLGMPSIIFDKAAMEKVGADVDVFCRSRSYKKEFANLEEEALAMRPLNISEEAHLIHCATVKAIVDGYRASNPAIVSLWKEAGQALSYVAAGQEIEVGSRGLIRTCADGMLLPNGMKIYYHHLKQSKDGNWRYMSDRKKNEFSYIYSGKCVENCVQALARIVLTDQEINILKNLNAWVRQDPSRIYRIVTSTYDEVVIVVPEDRAAEALQMMKIEMATAPPWCPDLPLKSSGGYGKSYGDCEK